jgi:23S rRNA pseudouridine2605 synthase
MCEAVGLTVVRLKRVRYGFLGLEGLRQGEYRLLTRDEADRLRLLGRGSKGAEQEPRYREGKKRETPGERQKGKALPVKLTAGKRAGTSQGKKVKDGTGRGK